MFIRFRTAIAPALLLSLAAFAEDPVTVPGAPPTDNAVKGEARAFRTIHLKSGTVIEGVVVDLKDDSVIVEFADVPGSRGSISRNLIVPSDVFDILVESYNPTTGEGWLNLATEAENLGLHNDRIRSLRNALRLSPDRTEEINKAIAQSRQLCSNETISRARDFLDAGELERGRRFLQTALTEYVECVGKEEGEALMKRVNGDIAAEQARATVVLSGRQKIQDSHEELQSVRALIQRGEESLRVGRESLERPGNAINHFEEAQLFLMRASKQLAGFSRTIPTTAATNDELVKEVLRLREALRDDRVAVHIELGNAYLSRSNFVGATAQAGEAAALDPENSGVEALRIAIAAGRSINNR